MPTVYSLLSIAVAILLIRWIKDSAVEYFLRNPNWQQYKISKRSKKFVIRWLIWLPHKRHVTLSSSKCSEFNPVPSVYLWQYYIFYNFFSHFRNRLSEEQTSFGQVWCSKKDFTNIWWWRGSYHWSVDLCSCKVFCWDMRVNIFFSYSWRKRHIRFPWWPNL